ncbi:CapA family protein [Phycicoccus flavus]|uniref:CapA family protein n=1 Tax=Phycicoccus flavus TaxID=2502783 RepID=UPI000FEBB490|nr:CapA family protein [Phycicoccus flavus]NHA68487.1 hypothetical protein [Phycicoccus flavus]
MSALRLTGVVAACALAVAGLTQLDAGAQDGPARPASGLVVDDTGAPVAGATVRLGDATVRTGADGRFRAPADAAAVADVRSPGHLARAQVLEPGVPTRVVLTRRGEGAVSLRFGGDAMMGRRFFTSRDGAPPLLAPNATPADHAAVLSAVRPLLADSDLTVVNLETPLVADPVVERGGRRVRGFHPTKDLVIASSTAMAEGLRLAGVDVVSLGNNHAADALGPGVDSTVRALDAAGIAHFGAGDTPEQAWAPAVVERRGTRVAFLGCTTVTGAQHAVPYVATATDPGAAACEAGRLDRAVRDARSRADVVVVMIHGDVEYVRTQTPAVRRLARVAADAGSTLVVAGHPHVVGGLTTTGDAVFAESMGNIVFDQELWDTLPTYLARVDVRGGRPVAVGADPVLVDGYRPRPAVGGLADAVARIAAGTVPGPARLDAGGARLDPGADTVPLTTTAELEARTPARLAPGWWLPSQPGVRGGFDVLFGTGDFGAVAVGRDGGADRLWLVDEGDDADTGADRLWDLGRYARITPAAACTTGEDEAAPRGLELARSPLSTRDVIATIEHRAPVRPGQELSLLADVRRASTGARLEVRWYRAMSGGSSSTSELVVPEVARDSGDCAPVRLDLVVPDGVVAAQVFARVQAPHGGQTLRYLGVDDVRLVAWDENGRGGRRFDTVESALGGPTLLSRDDADVGGDAPLR